MYCINCGVKLEDTEKKCPLCGVKPYHPEVIRQQAEPLYPQNQYPRQQISSRGVTVMILTAFVLAASICFLCDLSLSGGVSWSGYVIGALVLAYIVTMLPSWFNKPNPVIFVPCDFAATALYLLYVDLASGGNWFLSFALPVTGGIALIVTTVVTVYRYVKRGRLFLFGGAFMALGAFSLLVEFLLNVTFPKITFVFWSIYPLVTFVLLGAMLMFLALCRPARETMERKFFI